jgi:hypothetical protein
MEPYAFEVEAAYRREELVRRAELIRLASEGRPRLGRRRRIATTLHALAAWIDERQSGAESRPGLEPQRAGGPVS